MTRVNIDLEHRDLYHHKTIIRRPVSLVNSLVCYRDAQTELFARALDVSDKSVL